MRSGLKVFISKIRQSCSPWRCIAAGKQRHSFLTRDRKVGEKLWKGYLLRKRKGLETTILLLAYLSLKYHLRSLFANVCWTATPQSTALLFQCQLSSPQRVVTFQGCVGWVRCTRKASRCYSNLETSTILLLLG
jgi:hypothetical protein